MDCWWQRSNDAGFWKVWKVICDEEENKGMSNSAGSFPLFMTLMTLLITLPLTAMFYSCCTTFIQLSHNVKVSPPFYICGAKCSSGRTVRFAHFQRYYTVIGKMKRSKLNSSLPDYLINIQRAKGRWWRQHSPEITQVGESLWVAESHGSLI